MEKCKHRLAIRLVHLGVVCDSAKCRFEVPEDILAKLEALITTMAVDSKSITFAVPDKLRGGEVNTHAGGSPSREPVHVPHVQADRADPAYRNE